MESSKRSSESRSALIGLSDPEICACSTPDGDCTRLLVGAHPWGRGMDYLSQAIHGYCANTNYYSVCILVVLLGHARECDGATRNGAHRTSNGRRDALRQDIAFAVKTSN